MYYRNLLGKTVKDAPADEESINAKLLQRAGFIDKLGSGIYSFLPLGWKVHKKIEEVIRQEINKIGGQELNMPALHPKSVWEKTDRWANFDALFKLVSRQKENYALGATHEEVLTPIVAKFVASYKELPLYAYQIQVKFRDEPRAKSGLLRGREFIMKDLYSFHTTEEDRIEYYQKVKTSYEKIFKRVGLNAIYTEALGGVFSHRSHEFQVIATAGEDTIYYCEGKNCGFAQNKEIAEVKEGDRCHKCTSQGQDEKIKSAKAIEVGNIFPLGTRFSKACDAYFTDEEGKENPMIMGCYGIGVGRVMGTVVEVHNDQKGILWPKEIAPFHVHLLNLNKDEKYSDLIYRTLLAKNIDVLYDDREEVSAGEKFATSDLIGIPIRLVISQKTGERVELKMRGEEKIKLYSVNDVINTIHDFYR